MSIFIPHYVSIYIEGAEGWELGPLQTGHLWWPLRMDVRKVDTQDTFFGAVLVGCDVLDMLVSLNSDRIVQLRPICELVANTN